MNKGIYCYYDDVKHETIYVGKDSNIDKKTRHRTHMTKCNYDKQKINIVLQNDLENNINRYTYVVLETSDDWTNEDLNEKEKYWISLFKPKFNFTEGGDGFGSGENHPRWKNYARVIKKGINTKGKQNYALIHNGKIIKYSINKEELEKLAEEINKLENKDEEIIKKIIEENNARVIKYGTTTNGKQNYALIHNGKYLKYSIKKEKLEELADKINTLETSLFQL